MLNYKQLEAIDYIFLEHKDTSTKGFKNLAKSLKSLGISGKDIVQYVIWNQQKYI